MSAPPCGILAITMAFDLGRIQNSLDSATDARSGLGEFEPDRLQDFQHVFGVDLSNDLIGQRRRMRLECRPPLLAVLFVPEPTFDIVDESVREIAQCDLISELALCLPAFLDLVAPFVTIGSASC